MTTKIAINLCYASLIALAIMALTFAAISPEAFTESNVVYQGF